MDKDGQPNTRPVQYSKATNRHEPIRARRMSGNKSAFYEKLMFFETKQHTTRELGRTSSPHIRPVPSGLFITASSRNGATSCKKEIFALRKTHSGSDPKLASRTSHNVASVEGHSSCLELSHRNVYINENDSHPVANSHIHSKSEINDLNEKASSEILLREFSSNYKNSKTTNFLSENSSYPSGKFVEKTEKNTENKSPSLRSNDASYRKFDKNHVSQECIRKALFAQPDASSINADKGFYRLKNAQSNSSPNLLLNRVGSRNNISSPKEDLLLNETESVSSHESLGSNSFISFEDHSYPKVTMGDLSTSDSLQVSKPVAVTPEASAKPKLLHNDHETLKSTAIIRLVQSLNPASIKRENKERKIHVIKSANQHRQGARQPTTRNRSSPRLDEWLRSVMKVQKEMASQNTDCWSFPDEESISHSTISTFSELQPIFYPEKPNYVASDYLSETRRLSSPLPCKTFDEHGLDFINIRRSRSSPIPELSERHSPFDKSSENGITNNQLEIYEYQPPSVKEARSYQIPDTFNIKRITKSQKNNSYFLSDPLCLQRQNVIEKERDELLQARRRWSTTGINTDITVPMVETDVHLLCGFCSNSHFSDRTFECASARLHGICCACRHAVGQGCHSLAAKTLSKKSDFSNLSRTKENTEEEQDSVFRMAQDNFANCTTRLELFGDDTKATTINTNGSEIFRPFSSEPSPKEPSGLEATHPTVGITIRVTGEEETHFTDNIGRTPSAFKAVKDTHKSTQSFESTPTEAGKRFEQSSVPRGMNAAVTRGTSPHYMFPSSSNPGDDEFLLRQPMSPRNSIGSISSSLSYKSSNADSAVDLGPPDDDNDHDNNGDQEFEFDEFLAKQQDKPTRSLYQLPDLKSCVPHLSILPDVPYLSPFTTAELSGHNIKQQSSVSYLAKTSSSVNFSFPNSTTSTPVPVPEQCNEHDPQIAFENETSSITIKLPKSDSIPSELDFWNKKDASNVFSRYNQSNLVHLQKIQQSEHLEQNYFSAKTSASLSSKTQISNVYVDLKHHFKPLLIEESPDDTGRCNFQMQNKNEQSKQVPSPYQQLPELIISDHSVEPTDQSSSPASNHSPHPPNLVLEDNSTSSDNESSLNSHSPSPNPSVSSGSYTPTFGDLLQVRGHMGLRRTSSASSVSSEGSTCSTCSFVSDCGTRPKKTSSWRKIRSFILWSPFIQVFKKHRYPWIQLAGHQGNFHAGEAGSVLKKLDPREQKCFQRLMADPLKEFVPEYRGNVEKNGEMYIQLQDLLASFSQPCVMDVKMGVRTYLEAELEKARKSPTLRKDMYQKMVEVDNTAPTQAEHEQRAVTKPRYMQWRDQMSSSTELGFRVEGIKKTDGSSTKDFKKTKSRGNIVDIIVSFVANNETIAAKYVKRLKEIMAVQETSAFFRAHEVVGSSLLFVHDAEENVGVWMIDFGKTEQLSGDKTLDHRSEWQEGNREDGYLFGLDNMISIFEEVHTNLSSSSV